MSEYQDVRLLRHILLRLLSSVSAGLTLFQLLPLLAPALMSVPLLLMPADVPPVLPAALSLPAL